jgi:hypothetical protein
MTDEVNQHFLEGKGLGWVVGAVDCVSEFVELGR